MKMRACLVLCTFLLIFVSCQGFIVVNNAYIPLSRLLKLRNGPGDASKSESTGVVSDSISSSTTKIPDVWYNPAYPKHKLKERFLAATKPLLRVGGKGIAETHVNSLNELLEAHTHVRVKVAGQRKGVNELSKEFLENEGLRRDVEILMLTQREMLFGIPEQEQ